MNEHGQEPARGLPGCLPKGERLLWQGKPDVRSLTLRALHLRSLSIYFGLMFAWYVASESTAGVGGLPAARAILIVGGVALVPIALIALYGWMTARSTVYTITDRRVVIRFGLALPASVNIPFRLIASAGLRVHSDGTGEIPLTLIAGERLAYFLLWPHARPWRLARAEPMLRAVPQAEQVAQLLSRALAASAGMQAEVAASVLPTPRASKIAEPSVAAVA